MYSNNKLTKAVRLAIAFGAVSAFAGSAVAQQAQQNEEESAKVERIEVTGSRIKRTDLEGALPITVIDREQIDLSGQMSVSDLLRNTTFNSFGSYRSTSGNASQGTTQVSLRGLGSSRTLILVDGRRLPTSPISGSGQDLNTVPLAAVERVEVLSDGASAVYGSDAIGGVINIITRKDYDGAELRLGAGRVSIPSEGGDREEGSFVIGTSTNKSRLLAGFSWNERDIIFERHFPWNQGNRGISPYGNNWAEVTSSGRAPASSNALSLGTAACEGLNENWFTTQNPWIGGDMCSYDFRQTNANDSSVGTQSMFFRASQDITDDWQVYANASAVKSKSFGRYAASLNDPGSVISANSPNNPTNPNSPLYNPATNRDGVAAPRPVAVYHRFASLGTRDSQVDNYTTDVQMGFTGMVNDVEVEFGGRKTKTKVYNMGNGYLLRSVANEAMENGTYMLNDPLGSRFTTPEDRAAYSRLLDSLNITISRINLFDMKEVFANASFDVLELQHGMVQMFVGTEYRSEDYADIYDSQSAAGTVGGSAGSSAGGGRNVRAAYFETLVPVLDNLELNFAGRYDKYSDYGSDFSPKASLRYEPLDGLVLRASYGKGFRAPTLDILTQQPSPGNPQVRDFVLCDFRGQTTCPQGQLRATTVSNSELASEKSTQIALGLAYQPTDWVNFAVDYYDIEITDAISFIGLQALINTERAGDAFPTGLGIVRDPVTRVIVDATTGYANRGSVETNGLDINVRFNFDLGNVGRLTHNLQFGHVFEYSIDGGRNLVRDPGTPRQRASLSNVYSYGDFDFAWNINAIGNQYNSVTRPTTGPNAGQLVKAGNIATWITHDAQVRYTLGWNADIVVGVQNLFEKYPQLDTGAADGRGFDYTLYDGSGRISYVRYTQRF